MAARAKARREHEPARRGRMTARGAGGARKRKAAELSDRHADLADKMGDALARAQKRHIEDRLLSIEAAESYLEAGRLSQALSDECSRGELMKARRRAGITADRARGLIGIANWEKSASELYAAYNITLPFRTEAEARAWRADIATDSVEALAAIKRDSEAEWGGLAGMLPLSKRLQAYAADVVIESRADWQARTRGEITDAQTTSPDLAQAATWFGTFYTGNDEFLDNEAWPALAGAGARAEGEADPREPRVRRAVLRARRDAFQAPMQRAADVVFWKEQAAQTAKKLVEDIHADYYDFDRLLESLRTIHRDKVEPEELRRIAEKAWRNAGRNPDAAWEGESRRPGRNGALAPVGWIALAVIAAAAAFAMFG